MTSHEDKERELKQKEEELRQREQALRLQELESEINQAPPPHYKTRKHDEPERKLKRWSKKLLNIGKFFGIVIAVIASVKVAAWMATAVLVLGISWVSYKLFLEGDRDK